MINWSILGGGLKTTFLIKSLKKKGKVVHLYSTFSIWICSKALYNVNDRFTPSGLDAYIYKAVNIRWYSFYRSRKDGKLSEL